MKRFLLVLFVALGFVAQSQVYNNEWIDYSKTYYKFKVGRTGLYRISQATLASAGLNNIPAEQFQLWRNGQQVPIFTSVPSGVLGGSDYIEFWGEQNDGKPDNILYRNSDYQLNDKWSLQTDTAAFFLTVNPAGGNFQLQTAANNITGTQTPEPYFMYTSGVYYKNAINGGYAASVGEYVYSASYDMGEGWSTGNITPATVFNQAFSNLKVYSSGPNALMRVHTSGNAINPRTVRIRLNGDSIAGRQMDYFDYAKIEQPFSAGQLAENSTVQVSNLSAVASDRLVVHKIEIVYPRQFDFGGQSSFDFNLPANVAGNYLEISNFNYGSSTPVLYDLTNGKRYVADISNPAIVKVALEPSALDRRLLLVSEDPSLVIPVTSLQTRNFVNYALPANQGDFLIISHKSLFTSSSGANNVEEYRAYRASTAGGSYAARIYDIDELVDQFGLGIKKHPLSVRNFLMWSRANFSIVPKNVFLIGHGLTYNSYRINESNYDAERLNLIPTFGNPASDMLLSSTPTDPVPQTPIGRLSAINGNEVSIYLQKVKEYETAQAQSSPLIKDKAWMKNVVHVVGGSDEKLGTMLSDYMGKYKSIIGDSLFGANVNTFNKTSTNPVEQLGSNLLPGLFQDGLSMLLYFGHSAANALAFNLDDPKRYNNPGKYPVMIMLGCNAGNFFTYNIGRFSTQVTISESFTFAPQRGSIAYFASTHLGIVHYLDIYNTRTYTAIGRTKYGQTLGEQLVEAIRQVYNLTTTEDYYARFHTEENTLHGDPAIRLNAQVKPDYAIEEANVRVVPSFVSVSKNNFTVSAKFFNLGRVADKDIVIEVKRQYPNMSSEVVYKDTIPGIRYADSISITLPIIATRDHGLNKITITVDATNAVDELYETNNTITKDLVIYNDDATPIYPYNYSIVNKHDITFSASTSDPFAVVEQYRFEIDTTELFNSSSKFSQTISSTGGILQFKPSLVFSDSTVYYWRVAPVPVSGEPKWNNSSFIYLANSDFGYNQSHYFQHLGSATQDVILDTTTRKWNFGLANNSLFVRTGVYPTSGTDQADFYVTPNEVSYISGGCSYDELIINVFDSKSFKAWKNNYSGPTGLYGSLKSVCGPLREYNFEFLTNSSVERKKAMDFIDLIPDGSYVVIRPNINPNDAANTYPNIWKADESIHGAGNSLYHKLLNQGFATIDSFNRARPWLFVFKKNAHSDFHPDAVFGQGIYDKLGVQFTCTTPDSVGRISSPVFGPSKAWKQLKWDGSTSPDAINGDNPKVDVVGIRKDNSEQVLFTNIDLSQRTLDVSSIDPSAFPYVQLRMRNADSLNYTPFQLNYWRITYDPVPEGALAPNLAFDMKDSLEVGEPMKVKLAFKNVSEVPFSDSMRIKLVVRDRNNVENIVPISRGTVLKADSLLYIEKDLNTNAFPGLNTLFVDVNPEDDQPEQFHFNNFAYREFYIKPDSLSPFLDVTFDGVHILNKDIVSSKPAIVMKLKDESKWLVLNDTSLVSVQVKYPDGSIKDFNFVNDTLKFIPVGQAPSTNNTATVEFLPSFQQDGDYELIVTGKDRSSNLSGKMEYRISFQVINKPMISNMLNYPNPFTTSTAFVFTVTGSEVPQNLRIQILTITGKIVREITKQELGPIHIGRNITEFKWDGTDQYGQKLANGVYLYRVITNLNGKSLDKYKAEGDNTDKYFNKGYGKMYLMR